MVGQVGHRGYPGDDLLKIRKTTSIASVLIFSLVAQVGAVQAADKAVAPEIKRPVPPIVSAATAADPEPAKGKFTLPGTDKALVPNKDLSNLSAKTSQPKALPAFKAPEPKADEKASHFVEGKSKELPGERKPNAKIFANPDGTKTAKVYGSPVHFKDPQGNWSEIDPKLIPDGAGFKNAAGPFAVRFAPSASSPQLANIEADGHKVTMALDQASNTPGAAVGQEITYPQVRPGVDLTYRVGKSQVKETLVLHRAPTPAGSQFTFSLDPGGLAPRQESDGAVGLYAQAERPVLIIPPASVWDSSVDAKSNEPAHGPASMALTGDAQGGWKISVSADHAWLADPARKYPVYLDPSFNYWGAQRFGG
ncbi:MAG: hypothetical protein ACRDIA_08775, partial [Actinomycetota bacterium]